MELTLDRNFKNYFHEYGAYQFSIDQLKCETLYDVFNAGFTKGLETYPHKENKLHHDLIIKDKIYPGYYGYRIYQGSQDIKEARKLQRKTTTTIKKEKLKEIRQRRKNTRENDNAHADYNSTQGFQCENSKTEFNRKIWIKRNNIRVAYRQRGKKNPSKTHSGYLTF